jgi:methionine biosynthesis protein MetW
MNDARRLSYTSPRADVFEMVPVTAAAILDVGCSNGALGASLRAAKPGRSVMGVERDPELFAEAVPKLDRVVQADLDTFDWASAFAGTAFDCIIFADVLEHLVDPGRQLKEAQNHLRSGGCVVISLPNIRHVTSFCSIFLKGTFPRRDRGIFDRTHLRWFTRQDARDLVREAGMEIEEFSYALRLFDRGDGMINKALRKLLDPVAAFAPIREFLAYQFCLRAVKAC